MARYRREGRREERRERTDMGGRDSSLARLRGLQTDLTRKIDRINRRLSRYGMTSGEAFYRGVNPGQIGYPPRPQYAAQQLYEAPGGGYPARERYGPNMRQGVYYVPPGPEYRNRMMEGYGSSDVRRAVPYDDEGRRRGPEYRREHRRMRRERDGGRYMQPQYGRAGIVGLTAGVAGITPPQENPLQWSAGAFLNTPGQAAPGQVTVAAAAPGQGPGAAGNAYQAGQPAWPGGGVINTALATA